MALRQRKGENKTNNEEQASDMSKEEVMNLFEEKMRSAMESKIRNDSQENISCSEMNQRVDEGLTKLFEPKKAPLPGLKHETKAAKDALDRDPYDLQLIFDLGDGYIQEDKCSNAANVLIRGWKRMGELDNPEGKFLFLLKLCHASNECGKYKQAEAVLEDMEEPQDPEMAMDYFRIKTKVYGNNKNLQKCLKAFNQGLEFCKTIENAMPLWLDTLSALKKVGAYDAAKSAIERLATDETDKQKLQVMETFSDMRTNLNAEAPKPVVPRLVMGGILLVFVCIAIYFLYVLESRSLKSLKLAK